MLSFAVWVTEKCNLRCNYCYEKKRFEQRADLTEDIEDILDFIVFIAREYKDEDVVLTFHGGEPLLKYNLIKRFVCGLKQILGERIEFGITTNGILLTDEMIDFLSENFVDVSISIDGIKEIHDRNRIFPTGEGSFDYAINSMNKLKDNGLEVRARMTLTPESVRHFYESIKFLYMKKIKYIVPAIAVNDLRWNQNDFLNLWHEVDRLVEDGYGDIPFFKRIINGPIELSKCSGGIKSFNIACDKRVYPCEYVVGDSKFKLGTVCNPKEVIENGKKYAEIYSKENVGECRTCSYKKYCEASRCKLFNYMNTGDVLCPSDNQCQVEHLKYNIWRKYSCQK